MDYVVKLNEGNTVELSHDLCTNDVILKPGDKVYLKVNYRKINIFDQEGLVNLITKEV